MDVKICTTCKIEKDISEFYKKWKYYQSQCKDCIKEKHKVRYKNNKDEILAKQHDRYINNETVRENKKAYMKYVYAPSHEEYIKQYRECKREERSIKNKENSDSIKEYYRTRYQKNREIIWAKEKERREKMWYSKMHWKTNREIAKLWIRPDTCPICWYNSVIVAHHPDNNKRNEIVFCCMSCHRLIHEWKIECPDVVDIANLYRIPKKNGQTK